MSEESGEMSTVRRASTLRPSANGASVEDLAKKEREREKMKRLAAMISPEGLSDDESVEASVLSVDSKDALDKVGAEFITQEQQGAKILPVYDRGHRKNAIGNLNVAVRRKSVAVTTGKGRKGSTLAKMSDLLNGEVPQKAVSYELIDLTGTEESHLHKEMKELSRSTYRAGETHTQAHYVRESFYDCMMTVLTSPSLLSLSLLLIL